MPAGSLSRAICSMRFEPWPELMLGADLAGDRRCRIEVGSADTVVGPSDVSAPSTACRAEPCFPSLLRTCNFVMSPNAIAEVGVGLDQHLIGPAELVERLTYVDPK